MTLLLRLACDQYINSLNLYFCVATSRIYYVVDAETRKSQAGGFQNTESHARLAEELLSACRGLNPIIANFLTHYIYKAEKRSMLNFLFKL